MSTTIELTQGTGADWFLQSLVRIANSSDSGFGITLQVSGMLVSGYLVSGRQYFEGFAADFSGLFDDTGAAGAIRDTLSAYGKIYDPQADGEDIVPPQFIHLQDARFFSTAGHPVPGDGGVWWRGRLSGVGGFSLGRLSVISED